MSWVRLDDGAPGHRKIVGLSDAAFRLWVVGLTYCNQQANDGRFSVASARIMSGYLASPETPTTGFWGCTLVCSIGYDRRALGKTGTATSTMPRRLEAVIGHSAPPRAPVKKKIAVRFFV